MLRGPQPPAAYYILDPSLYLCFADDLLIFIDGSLESVQAVLQVLKEFERRSGLAVSVHKTSFFASGLTAAETDQIQFSTGMPLGALPVRYLGVPLSTKKLTLLNCEGLLLVLNFHPPQGLCQTYQLHVRCVSLARKHRESSFC